MSRAESQGELLLVGVGMMGQPYVTAARRLGLRVRAVEGAARAAHVAEQVDGLVVSRGTHDELWAEGAWAAAGQGRPDGVLPFTEWNVTGAALLQDRLGLPGPSLHAATVSRNKALQRGLFAAAGIRQPEYVVTDDPAAVRDWVATRLPVVVKPLSSAGSAGVELVADLDAFLDVAARRGGRAPVLVETAVEGPEYSWEALVSDGRVWLANTTAKETTEAPSFVEVAHRTGVRLDAGTAAQADEFCAAVLEALGMRSGVVHLEYRLAADGPTLMEVAVRTPGDYLMDLLGLTYGIDWFEMAVRLAMSMPLPEPPTGPVGYAASYLPVAPPGVVVAVDGLDEVRAHPSVVTAGLWKQPGDVVPPTPSSADRFGHVVVRADTPEGRDEALEFVRRTLVARTRPA
ncbi:ATP-grasp domain-containing protein [Couchioplanes azureus]|uniref:ATP-grasp domain-containing protein n=1 Tax=Couchioplanes caeruleus TaxID=56438 RepID=UPI00166F6723|nr:ATP-grasp domain-containing protein [Couchioplanes caeruleus]GGQ69994.1 argininosuccinate lyase [Couchioplanes caeruleus subsp. azureus]